MVHRPGGITVLEGLKVERIASESVLNPLTIATHFPKTGFFQLEEFVIPRQSITIVDSGGAGGGTYTAKLCDMPATPYCVIGGCVNVEVFSSAAGINQSGSIFFGIGSVEAADGSLSGTDINFAGAASITLTSGAGAGHGSGPAIPTFLDGSLAAGNDAWFNVGVADANITADAAIDFEGVLRFFWLDLGRGL